MHPRFAAAIESLHGKFEALQTGRSYVFGELPVKMSTSGVYLFSEGGSALYVGRSNRLRDRYFLHCRPGSQQNQASFVFKLAKEAINAPASSYRADEGNRKTLAATDTFQAAFVAAKARIRAMPYRFVEETDQTCQALLEAYCAIVLDTPYNDFDTH